MLRMQMLRTYFAAALYRVLWSVPRYRRYRATARLMEVL